VAATWTPLRADNVTVFVRTAAWVRETSNWVEHYYTDDLEISYLDADQNVVDGPYQVGNSDGAGHYFSAGGYALGDVDFDVTPVYGVRISHRDPGETFPFWFSVDSVQYFTWTAGGPVDFAVWAASDYYGTSEFTPTYTSVPAGTWPNLWTPSTYITFLPRAAFNTTNINSITEGWPAALTGGGLPINATWLSGMNASTATSVIGDISPLPDDDEFADFYTIVSEPPLGDITIMFGYWVFDATTRLRQRQSRVRTPSRIRPPDLRQRQNSE
jgi:hypothetical protein